uniref:Plasmid replication protein RepL domain-containing protein n=1 Tax=uncultured prokaryote TaxID=198431 RepID=A0A0H5QI50_9ZZZZ|nr:hypothetical protein [uncultured prokaryote]
MKELTQPIGGEAVETGARVRYAANPFWDELMMETKRKRTTLKGEDGPKALVSLGTGQREGVVEVTKVYEVDAERFVKVFTRHLSVFFDLSQNGLRLFEYALSVVAKTHNKDAIHMHPIDADRYHKGMGRKGYSRASFYRGVAELIERGLIAESDITGKYFTNPAIYWNGDRARFITEMKQAPQILGPDDPDPTPGSGTFHEVPFSDDDELGH